MKGAYIDQVLFAMLSVEVIGSICAASGGTGFCTRGNARWTSLRWIHIKQYRWRSPQHFTTKDLISTTAYLRKEEMPDDKSLSIISIDCAFQFRGSLPDNINAICILQDTLETVLRARARRRWYNVKPTDQEVELEPC